MDSIQLFHFDKIQDREKLVREIGVDEEVVNLLSDKLSYYIIKIKGVSPAEANIIKQTALSRGTDAAVHRDVITGKIEKSDMLLFGTASELMKVANSLQIQPFGLSKLSKFIKDMLSVEGNKWEIRDEELILNKPFIMGILNITPDSFFDGGLYEKPQKAKERAFQMKEEGADIIDIGGESSRPGAEPISEEEELNRIMPVIESLSDLGIPISVDTYKAKVAEEALEAGVKIVNDISGMRFDKNLVKIVSKYRAGYVLMHMLGTPKDMQKNPYYEDVIQDISNFFRERINFALENGIKKESIVVDPGIGFGKRLEDNIEIFKRLKAFSVYGRPLLIGASRKSFIGMLTETRKEERLEGSLASVAIGYLRGVKIFRVHDVKETKRFLDVLYKIV